MAKAVAQSNGAGAEETPRLLPAAYGDLAGAAGWETARNCGSEREFFRSVETKKAEADENGKTFGRAVMDGGDGNPGSFFRLLAKRALRRNRPPGDIVSEEGAGEGGSAAVPLPAWR